MISNDIRDEVHYAQEVRDLALQANRLLREEAREPLDGDLPDFRAVLRRIDSLRRRLSQERRADPDWVYNDLAPWNYHALPAALGCRGWFTAKVTTLGELDAALARAATGESASYIEVVGGRLDFPAGLAMAHRHLDALYANG
jgi:hypothetical protein